ncbi:hypothetical protein WJX73_003337 [Symbiochloris irregularis]|uniref:SCP domain-containing protein n=1 Tax=Symbiochloris irregularis TaxID=706552 RepID=A0AAW1PC53_9CHLO
MFRGCPTTGSGNGNDSPYGNYVCPHNTARAQYGASALTYSATLESYAQNLVNKCVFAHSHGQYGENLYEASGNLATWQNAVSAWMGEASSYDASNPNYEVSGHFTQVVWKGSTSVGCAAANCGEMTIFACEYDPPGNYEGQYAQNVGSFTG